MKKLKDVDKEIEKDFGFKPDFEKAKHYLEANDGAGNTFKATAKPVLIGTAVVGATTMIFSLILLLKQTLGIDPETILSLLNPYTSLGFIAVEQLYSGLQVHQFRLLLLVLTVLLNILKRIFNWMNLQARVHQ